MVKYGTDPSQLPIVTPEIRNNKSTYVVREGNRRIAALQLLANPSLASSLLTGSARKKLEKLAADFAKNPINEIECVIFQTYDAVPKHWLKLKHTGENDGAGTVMWDGKAAARFAGGSVGLQAIGLVLNNVQLTPEETAALSSPTVRITTIDRLLLTPAAARQTLGFDLVDGNLTIVDNPERALSNLTQFVLDVAYKNLNSRSINKSAARIEHAEVTAKTAPKRDLIPGASLSLSKNTRKEKTTRAKAKGLPIRKTVASDRKLPISEPRAADIYRELQKLETAKFRNAAAILIRVFFELSIDHYAEKKKIDFQVYDSTGNPVKDRQIHFREKVLKVITFMRDSGVSAKITVQAQSLASDRSKIFYYERLHDYVHNPHATPLISDLPVIWDNLEDFAEALWS